MHIRGFLGSRSWTTRGRRSRRTGNSAMGKRVDTAELAKREYWSPEECARVLGRGRDWWVARFDDPKCPVSGVTETKSNGARRRIRAATARAYLLSLEAEQGYRWDPAAFRERFDAERAQHAGQG